MIRYLTGWIVGISLILLGQVSNAARTGIHWIGLANVTDTGVNSGVSALLQAGGDLEVTELPFNYNPGNPFGNADKVVQRTLPSLNGSLTMTIYLGFRRWESFPDNMFNWRIFQQGQGTYATRLAYLQSINWQGRLNALDSWIASTRNWANGRGVGGKLHIVVVPMLEDNCPDSGTYSSFLNVIASYQLSQGISVQYRRSYEGGYYYRVGNLPLEHHGPPPSGAYVGDVYSNDGDDMPVAQFITAQRSLLATGVSCLWWRDEWNGCPPYAQTAPTYDRTNLNPFAGTGIYSELVEALSSR